MARGAVSGAASKRKGSRVEREVAAVLGGKRTPLSGATGGGDVTLPPDSIWNSWSIEVKARKGLPKMVTDAMAQAQADIALADPRKPMVVLREDRGRMLAVVDLRDLAIWAEALAEVGHGFRLREMAAQLEAIARAIRSIA